MAVDKAIDSAKLDASLGNIADSLRDKLGTENVLRFPGEFELSVDAIEPGGYRVVVLADASDPVNGSTVVATKDEQSVEGTYLGDGIWEVVLTEPGTWSVSVTTPTLETQTSEFTFQSAGFMNFMSIPSLNDASWNLIRALSDAGQAANYWSVGDRKEIVLNGTIGHLTLENYTCYATILGFDHNAELEGRNRIHFQIGATALEGGTEIALCDGMCADYASYTGDKIVTERGWFAMNHTDDASADANNVGGWRACEMRHDICGTSLRNCEGTVIGALPEELRKVLKPVTKYTDNVGGSNAPAHISATKDYVFLLSEAEIGGAGQYGNINEVNFQKQYDYYAAGNSRLRYMHEHTDNATRHWLRSPDGAFDYAFAVVFKTGERFLRYRAQYSLGIAPCFCV